MKKLERARKNVSDNVLRYEVFLCALRTETNLGKLDVPVAEDVPGKVVDVGKGNANLKLVKSGGWSLKACDHQMCPLSERC